nr:MAG TPA: hypothetical protein [Caudoviricetes sp.]
MINLSLPYFNSLRFSVKKSKSILKMFKISPSFIFIIYYVYNLYYKIRGMILC